MTRAIAIVAALICSTAASTPSVPPGDRAVYRAGLAALVDVYVVAPDGVHTGSGALVSPTLVVTAAHVVRVDAAGKPLGVIAVSRSTDEPYDADAEGTVAEVVRRDGDADVALLRLKSPLKGAVPLAMGPAPEQGDAVYYFGNPDEAPTTFGRGVETRLHYPGEGHRWCQFNGFVWPGMSGGPVLDDRGRLVGVITALNVVHDLFDDDARVAVPNVGYHVPARDVAKLLRGFLP